jgi:hypothetical protein
MKPLDELRERIFKLRADHTEIMGSLQQQCWDTRREKELTQNIKERGLPDISELTEEHIVVKKLVPRTFPTQYRQWYACGKAILEVNHDYDSLNEFVQSYKSNQKYLDSTYISEGEQIFICEMIERQMTIIEALPAYLEGRMYDLKLTIASTLMGDELKEARVLFDKGFIRAAGALSGVVLERHIKLRFDTILPAIKYGEKVTLGQLIQKAEAHKLYDVVTIEKMKYLNAVRISCDHDKKSEPKEIEVHDLIEYTRRFIHYIE